MDPVLAELYGTVTPQEDIEKTAQLDLLQKIAEAHDIDLDQLSDDQILEAVDALDGVEKVAEEQYTEEELYELQKQAEAEELFRNSDYGGRIFAHAMIDELRGIQKAAEEGQGNPLLNAVLLEKEASRLPTPSPQQFAQMTRFMAGGGAGEAAKEQAKKSLVERVKGGVAAAGSRIKKELGSPIASHAERIGRRASIRTRTAGMSGTDKEQFLRSQAKKELGIAGGAAGATLLAGGGAAAAMRKKSFDEAVYERAAEHLAAAGLIDDSGEILDPGYAEKTAQDIDAAALGLLEQMGYPVEWY